jgi:hypothetical protein
MTLNASKTKAMLCSPKLENQKSLSLQLGGDNIEWVEDFTNLRSLITSNNNHSKEIKRHLVLPTLALKP